jgi:ABC-2 type transport system permease protein
MSAYLACARIEFRAAQTYRASYVMTFVLLLLQVYLMRVVWSAFYSGEGRVAGVGLHTMTVYATLAAVQYTLLVPWRFSPIQQRVREGKVAVDLLRPVGFPAQMLAGQLGFSLAMLPLVLVALPFALLIGAASAPASPAAAVGYAVALAGALCVSQLLSLLLGLVAFWTLETSGAFMVYRFTAQFFSGSLVPLFFMPGPVRGLAEALPFQATAYTPTAVYLGTIHGRGVLAALGVQLFWIVALSALAALAWSRAQRRVLLQGG